MRVALVGPFPLHPGRFSGGVERVASNLVDCLMTFDDLDLHAITCTHVVKRAVHLEHSGVTYHYLPSSARFATLSLYVVERRGLRRALREIQPDVVHAQDAIEYGYISLKAGYPLVISVHGIVREERKYSSTVVSRLRATARGLLVERHCVKNARHIIHQAGYAERYFGHLLTGKTHDIANPIADKFFDLNSTEEEGRLLYVGSVIPRKRSFDLVQALDAVRHGFPNVSLRIAGRTPDAEYLRCIREWIAGHDLERNVCVLGSVTEDQLLEEYRRCALLVLPSAEETSPMAIGEAMAAGKPVVATRVGAIPRLVDDGETGFLVDVGVVDMLADRILTALSDGGLRSQMGRLAKAKANRNFRRGVVARKVRQVYQEAIETATLNA